MTNDAVAPKDVTKFWFEAGPKKWFTTDAAFDAAIEAQFGKTVAVAGKGGLDGWQETAQGALALVLLLDQFTRNIHRGLAATWDFDGQALKVAEAAIARGFDTELPQVQGKFFYMPFMHAEDIDVQDRSVELCTKSGDEGQAKYARHHRDIIARFGRFPHRNAVLGRDSTDEELAYLADGGFKG